MKHQHKHFANEMKQMRKYNETLQNELQVLKRQKNEINGMKPEEGIDHSQPISPSPQKKCESGKNKLTYDELLLQNCNLKDNLSHVKQENNVLHSENYQLRQYISSTNSVAPSISSIAANEKRGKLAGLWTSSGVIIPLDDDNGARQKQQQIQQQQLMPQLKSAEAIFSDDKYMLTYATEDAVRSTSDLIDKNSVHHRKHHPHRYSGSHATNTTIATTITEDESYISGTPSITPTSMTSFESPGRLRRRSPSKSASSKSRSSSGMWQRPQGRHPESACTPQTQHQYCDITSIKSPPSRRSTVSSLTGGSERWRRPSAGNNYDKNIQNTISRDDAIEIDSNASFSTSHSGLSTFSARSGSWSRPPGRYPEQKDQDTRHNTEESSKLQRDDKESQFPFSGKTVGSGINDTTNTSNSTSDLK
eukprot:CAMPEP_0194447134 /NCGR_PEP_ID=MMETSP0176-20130528/128837_1 /TAXON_ID=216777 /ORGANISM="Proboscia alata, Strain PI-D3" /LENGTH=418 /DNA_ID=CAMNT_0039273949 /DNA_START=56 /DNA_END=1312 /DNA_ORIENTATION=-